MGRAMLSESLIQFSVAGWGCVPSLLLPPSQTVVEVMKIMVTSFKRSHECTATLSAHNLAAGHHWPTPLPETPGQVWVSLLWGHCFFLLGPGAQGLLCPLSVYFPVLCKLWQLYSGLMVTPSKRANAIPKSAAPRAPAAVHCWPTSPQEMLKQSSVSVSVGSLGLGAHKVCLSPLSISGGNGIWF